MYELQRRFVRAMEENASITNRAEQMEATIAQLENETEAVGDYITIYLHQRAQMKRTLADKETLINRMAREQNATQVPAHILSLKYVHSKNSTSCNVW
jgi:molecular chaperone GrpE (heat shock protein)